MDEWEKFNEISLLENKDFYKYGGCHRFRLQAFKNRFWNKGFETKDLGVYHDMYLKSDILLLPDFFENFKKWVQKFIN